MINVAKIQIHSEKGVGTLPLLCSRFITVFRVQ